MARYKHSKERNNGANLPLSILKPARPYLMHVYYRIDRGGENTRCILIILAMDFSRSLYAASSEKGAISFGSSTARKQLLALLFTPFYFRSTLSIHIEHQITTPTEPSPPPPPKFFIASSKSSSNRFSQIHLYLPAKSSLKASLSSPIPSASHS